MDPAGTLPAGGGPPAERAVTPDPRPVPDTRLGPSRRLLLIDDEESLRHSLAKSLRRAGFVVETAATGREGVDRFQSGGFDAVVTDVRLPDLSGLDIVALLTEIDASVPVVVMTGYGSVESAMEAMRRGARDYLQKPFEMNDLLRVLESETAAAGTRDGRRLRAQVERRFAPEGYVAVEHELRRMPAPGEIPPGAASPAGEPLPTPAAAEPLALRKRSDASRSATSRTCSPARAGTSPRRRASRGSADPTSTRS